VSTPQTYTITETNEYSTTDGSKRFTFTAGTVIPMSLAIDMGLTGAGYDDPVYFTANEQAAIDKAAALMPFVETFPAHMVNAPVASMAADYLYFCRVRVGAALTIDTMTYEVGVAAGNVDLGVYTESGGTWTRVARTGVTAAAGATALQSIALESAYTLEPGIDYYLTLACDNATLTVSRAGVNGVTSFYGYRAGRKSSTFGATGLPETFTSPISHTAAIWIVGSAA
jgi:hypothetical protein